MTQPLILDDRRHDGLVSSLGTPWRGFSDRVMGGVSVEQVGADEVEARRCLRLRGDVRLDNGGGFLQMALDLAAGGDFDASGFHAVALEVLGNGETYNLHLRTADCRLPWQSYRAAFEAPAEWRRLVIPFAGFRPYRIPVPLNRRRLRRLALVAIGRAFAADLCLARLELLP